MVIFDATGLLLLLNEKTSPPKDPATGTPLADAHQRIEKAINDVRERGDKVLIPAPVFAELLVRAENASSAYVDAFNHSPHFKPVPFDQKAAVEHAIYTRKAIENGAKKEGLNESLCKVKFDRQIVAIAKAEGADTIYTDDGGLSKHAKQQGLTVIHTHEIALNAQQDLPLERAAEAEPMQPLPEIAKGDGIVETPPPR